MAKIVFFGSPQFAVPVLEALISHDHQVVLVVSAKDKRRGRGKKPSPTPVKRAALELGLCVTDDLAQVKTVDSDIGVIVAFGQLIKKDLLERFPIINMHFSMLPRWRGAAPAERAILAGDPTTGVSIMRIGEGLDTGPVYFQSETKIGEHETALELYERLVAIGVPLLLDTIRENPEPQVQIGNVVVADKIADDELDIDWTESAERISRITRIGVAKGYINKSVIKIHKATALSAEVVGDVQEGKDVAGSSLLAPGTIRAQTLDSKRVLIVQCGEGALVLGDVTPSGKQTMDAIGWWNGMRGVESLRFDAKSRLTTSHELSHQPGQSLSVE